MMTSLQNKIPPPIIMLLMALLMWLLHFKMPIYQFNNSFTFYIGILFILLGITLDVKSLFDFKINKTTISPISLNNATALVIEGFYRISRNPMYLGMLFILLGVASLFASLSCFLLVPLFVFLINHLQIKAEEAVLEEKFSIAYIKYKRKVRRWL